MTLCTSIYLFPKNGEPPEVMDVWKTCATLANFPMELSPKPNEDGHIVSPRLSGAKAWIKVVDDIPVRVSLDTVYGRSGQETHNKIIAALITKYPNCHVLADNEFDGSWHYGETPYRED